MDSRPPPFPKWLCLFPAVARDDLVGLALRHVAEPDLLLREKGLSVSEIGGRVGYDSAGKFTGAFKKVMHLTPSEYRRERGTRYEE